MNREKFIVTGGCGFIGSHLVEKLLQQQAQVVILDNLASGNTDNIKHLLSHPSLEFINADITADATLNYFEGCHGIFHLAALADIVPSITNPDSYFQSNVVGTFNVMQSARRYNIKKVIYAASSSCYGIPKQYPTSENIPNNPLYPYALTKMLGEELALHWGAVYRIPTVSLRLFNVYGPRARTNGTYGAMFGVFLAQILAGEPLTVVGDGTQTRDFVYVSDVVNAFISAMNSTVEHGIYNVGSSKPVSVNYIAHLLNAEKNIVHIPKRPGEPDCTHADITHIQHDLNWQPQTSIEEGVLMLLNNIDYWKTAPVWTPQKIQAATAEWFKYLGDKSHA